jgi:hypothetical protein
VKNSAVDENGSNDIPVCDESQRFFACFVNPKLKCHPNAQSRNVTFLLAQNTEVTTTFSGQYRGLVESQEAIFTSFEPH